MERVLAFVAAPEADTSLDFRELVVKVHVTTADQFLACLKAALALPEPTRTAAVLGVLQDVLESKIEPVQEALFTAVETVEGALGAMLRGAGRDKHRNALLTCLIDLCRGASPVFRARLLRLISVVMPALDKSGLNLRGAIAPPSFMPAERHEDAAAVADEGNRLDYVLYGAFYRVQQIVSTATIGKQFDALSKAVDTVLVAIAACPPMDKAARKSGKPHVETLAYFRDPEALLAHFTPEFDRDGRFKVQVLVQLATFLNHVEGQASKAGAGAGAGGAAATAAALPEREQQWLKATRKRVMGEVRRLCGSQKWLEKLLKEDSVWAQWRSDGAKVEPVASDGGAAASAGRAEAGELPDDSVGIAAVAAPQRRKAATGLGNAELSRLWALAATHKMEDDTGADVVQPSYETFLQRVREDADPANDIEDTYRACNNAVFEWKTLRALVEQNAALINLKGVVTNKSPLEALVATLAQSGGGGGGGGGEEAAKKEPDNGGDAAPTGDAASAAEPEEKRSRTAGNGGNEDAQV